MCSPYPISEQYGHHRMLAQMHSNTYRIQNLEIQIIWHEGCRAILVATAGNKKLSQHDLCTLKLNNKHCILKNQTCKSSRSSVLFSMQIFL